MWIVGDGASLSGLPGRIRARRSEWGGSQGSESWTAMGGVQTRRVWCGKSGGRR